MRVEVKAFSDTQKGLNKFTSRVPFSQEATKVKLTKIIYKAKKEATMDPGGGGPSTGEGTGISPRWCLKKKPQDNRWAAGLGNH